MAMLKINQDDYAYSTARIRAKEIKLLDNARLERMLEAVTPEEAYKALNESEYGAGGDSSGNVYSFETLLSEEMRKTYALLEEIAPQIEVVRAFQRRHDFFNVKVLLKAEFSNQDPPAILMDTGTFDRENIRTMIRERDYNEMPLFMRQAIAEIYDVFPRTQDPQIVDSILDKASYEQLAIDLKAIDNPFLHELADIMIDITNIKIFIRARSIGKAWDFLKKQLISGGEIPEKVYAENSDKPAESFVGDIRHTRYGDAVHKGWELFSARKNISGLEKLLEDYLMETVRKAKLITMGVEPFIAWLFAKEAEIRNVRIIMTGKINGLSNDLIRERLRLVYV
jgi:V/A-type H+-transporting ATPase subunit C